MQASDENDRGMDSAMSRVRIRPALNGLGVNRHRRGYTVTNRVVPDIVGPAESIF